MLKGERLTEYNKNPFLLLVPGPLALLSTCRLMAVLVRQGGGVTQDPDHELVKCGDSPMILASADQACAIDIRVIRNNLRRLACDEDQR